MDYYLRINKYFLSVSGLWPYQTTKEKIFFRIITHGIVTLIIVPACIAMYDARHEYTVFIECIPPIFTVLGSYIYAISCAANLTKVQSLIDHMRKDWQLTETSEAELEILRRSAERGKYLVTVIAFYNYLSIMCYLMTPLLPQLLNIISPLNETRPKLYVFHLNYVCFDKKDHYNLVYIHSILSGLLTLTNILGVDFIFLVSVQHACGQFKIIGHRLAHIIDDSYKIKRYKINQDDKIYQRIVECIRLHNNLLTFTDEIEACFSTMFVFIIGMNMLMISFQGVQIVLNINNTAVLFRFSSFFFGQMVHLFFSSVPGQMLMDESSKLGQYCYESEWIDMPVKSQKLILLVMLRSLRECKVTAGKIYIISMENFGIVMKTSFSYLSVLTSKQ